MFIDLFFWSFYIGINIYELYYYNVVFHYSKTHTIFVNCLLHCCLLLDLDNFTVNGSVWYAVQKNEILSKCGKQYKLVTQSWFVMHSLNKDTGLSISFTLLYKRNELNAGITMHIFGLFLSDLWHIILLCFSPETSSSTSWHWPEIIYIVECLWSRNYWLYCWLSPAEGPVCRAQ